MKVCVCFAAILLLSFGTGEKVAGSLLLRSRRQLLTTPYPSYGGTTSYPYYQGSTSYPYYPYYQGSTSYPYYQGTTSYPYYQGSTSYPYYQGSTSYPYYQGPATTLPYTNYATTQYPYYNTVSRDPTTGNKKSQLKSNLDGLYQKVMDAKQEAEEAKEYMDKVKAEVN